MAETRKWNTRAAASWILLAFQLTFSVLHLFPPLAYRVGLKGATTQVVAYINELGPVWALAFGLSACGLFLALLSKKGRHIWHLITGSVFMGYATALFVGAWGEAPHGPITYPVLAILPVIGNFLLALSYGGDR